MRSPGIAVLSKGVTSLRKSGAGVPIRPNDYPEFQVRPAFRRRLDIIASHAQKSVANCPLTTRAS